MSTTLSPDVVALLADPETHAPVVLASDAQLEALRARVRDGTAKVRGGGPLPEEFEAALLSRGNHVAYLVVGGIPNFLIDDRIELAEPL